MKTKHSKIEHSVFTASLKCLSFLPKVNYWVFFTCKWLLRRMSAISYMGRALVQGLRTEIRLGMNLGHVTDAAVSGSQVSGLIGIQENKQEPEPCSPALHPSHLETDLISCSVWVIWHTVSRWLAGYWPAWPRTNQKFLLKEKKTLPEKNSAMNWPMFTPPLPCVFSHWSKDRLQVTLPSKGSKHSLLWR